MDDLKGFIQGFVGVVIALIVAINLVPVLNTTLLRLNQSDPVQAAMGTLIGLVVEVGIVMFAVRALL
jgi:hypothetical protein